MKTPLSLLFNKAVHSAHPIYASIELTYACNLACRYCYNPVERKNQPGKTSAPANGKKPLSYGEIVDVLDQLRDMNVLYLTLTGGEPLLHPRFWEIAKAAKERPFALRLFSNGVLIDAFVADQIAEFCSNCVEISIHGAKPSTADALTQVKGSFDKQMRALELLRERGVRVYLKCVVTNILEAELDGIQAIGDRFGFPVYFDPVLTVSDDGEAYPLDLLASDEALRKLYSDPAFKAGVSPFEQEPGEFNCTVGSGIISIGPYGDVQPCIQWKQSIGNVRDKRIAEMWEDSPLLREVRKINRKLPNILSNFEGHSGYCFACPGLSQLRTGDPLRPDEQYLRVMRIRQEIERSRRGLVSEAP